MPTDQNKEYEQAYLKIHYKEIAKEFPIWILQLRITKSKLT